jgi:hypothetical protein
VGNWGEQQAAAHNFACNLVEARPEDAVAEAEKVVLVFRIQKEVEVVDSKMKLQQHPIVGLVAEVQMVLTPK